MIGAIMLAATLAFAEDAPAPGTPTERIDTLMRRARALERLQAKELACLLLVRTLKFARANSDPEQVERVRVELRSRDPRHDDWSEATEMFVRDIASACEAFEKDGHQVIGAELVSRLAKADPRFVAMHERLIEGSHAIPIEMYLRQSEDASAIARDGRGPGFDLSDEEHLRLASDYPGYRLVSRARERLIAALEPVAREYVRARWHRMAGTLSLHASSFTWPMRDPHWGDSSKGWDDVRKRRMKTVKTWFGRQLRHPTGSRVEIKPKGTELRPEDPPRARTAISAKRVELPLVVHCGVSRSVVTSGRTGLVLGYGDESHLTALLDGSMGKIALVIDRHRDGKIERVDYGVVVDADRRSNGSLSLEFEIWPNRLVVTVDGECRVFELEDDLGGYFGLHTEGEYLDRQSVYFKGLRVYSFAD